MLIMEKLFLVIINVLVLKTEIACERECSRGEDYRLVKLTIIDFNVLVF